MPLKRLEKTRATLPSGYQYGDAMTPQRARMLSALRKHVATCDAHSLDCIRCQVAITEGISADAIARLRAVTCLHSFVFERDRDGRRSCATCGAILSFIQPDAYVEP